MAASANAYPHLQKIRRGQVRVVASEHDGAAGHVDALRERVRRDHEAELLLAEEHLQPRGAFGYAYAPERKCISHLHRRAVDVARGRVVHADAAEQKLLVPAHTEQCICRMRGPYGKRITVSRAYGSLRASSHDSRSLPLLEPFDSTPTKLYTLRAFGYS